MAFELPPLPYAKDAFRETLSAETFDYHYGKHHKAYVTKTNELVAADAKLSGASLSEVIIIASEGGDRGLFNNAAQLWNHSFYWQCLSPDAQQPTGRLADLINEGFGSTQGFLDKFKAEAVGHFSNGWAWLILKGDRLEITSLHDADSPVAHGMAPLLTLDVWEHAYYIDYRNVRADYLDALLQRAINWEFVARNLDGQGVSRADQQG
jgi:Fe-Mn family superoxide dismutase